MIKLFYIEDEPSLGKIVADSLRTRNFEVLHLEDGKDAIEHYKEYDPDICVLDVMLPSIDGFTIAKQLRALNKNIPLIFLTAKNQSEDVIEGFKVGGNDYIRKPFSMEELIARIHNLLHLTNSSHSFSQKNENEIKLGKYIFSHLKQELHIDSEIKRLSYRESQLLKMLVENIGDVVQRKDILDVLWGDDSFFNSRNLDVYITKLREYLKKDETVEIITLKAVGYRVVLK